MYRTTIHNDTWTCTCGSPYQPTPAARMTAEEARTEAEVHADFYGTRGLPHEVRVAITAGGAA